MTMLQCLICGTIFEGDVKNNQCPTCGSSGSPYK